MSSSDSENDSDIYELTEFSDYEDSEEREEREEREREREREKEKGEEEEREEKGDRGKGEDAYEDEYNQVPAFGQFQHMGEANELDIAAGFDLDPKNRRKMMANLSGEERFRKIANQYIKDNFKRIINPSVISRLLEYIKKIEYKNPKAFVLAYYFIADKKDKKDTDLSEIMSDYITDEEMGIDIKDIVRYIRLIRNYK
jgi:hypothetical protein